MTKYFVTLRRGGINGWEVAAQHCDLTRANANSVAKAMGDTIAALDPDYAGTHPVASPGQFGRVSKTYVLPAARLEIEIRPIA